jgi:ribosomal 50S subunit-associated protein YjgA (DUF615 family)
MSVRKAEKEFEALRARLGDTPPAALRALAGPQLEDLVTAVTDARRRQGEALAAAGERALGYIPRLLRGPVRRVMG